jgi:hypothetical protein
MKHVKDVMSRIDFEPFVMLSKDETAVLNSHQSSPSIAYCLLS